MGVVSFALVIYYQNMKRLNAGMLTVLINRVGDVIILLRIGFIATQGHWVVTIIWEFQLRGPVSVLIIVAGMTKSAQIPFSR